MPLRRDGDAVDDALDGCVAVINGDTLVLIDGADTLGTRLASGGDENDCVVEMVTELLGGVPTDDGVDDDDGLTVPDWLKLVESVAPTCGDSVGAPALPNEDALTQLVREADREAETQADADKTPDTETTLDSDDVKVGSVMAGEGVGDRDNKGRLVRVAVAQALEIKDPLLVETRLKVANPEELVVAVAHVLVLTDAHALELSVALDDNDARVDADAKPGPVARIVDDRECVAVAQLLADTTSLALVNALAEEKCDPLEHVDTETELLTDTHAEGEREALVLRDARADADTDTRALARVLTVCKVEPVAQLLTEDTSLALGNSVAEDAPEPLEDPDANAERLREEHGDEERVVLGDSEARDEAEADRDAEEHAEEVRVALALRDARADAETEPHAVTGALTDREFTAVALLYTDAELLPDV